MGILAERIDWIKRCIDEINSILNEIQIEDLISRLRYIAMILYLLQSSIQALIDMGARILSKLGKNSIII